jgi:hypothetical protein
MIDLLVQGHQIEVGGLKDELKNRLANLRLNDNCNVES